MVTEENEKFFDIFSNAIIKIENTKTGKIFSNCKFEFKLEKNLITNNDNGKSLHLYVNDEYLQKYRDYKVTYKCTCGRINTICLSKYFCKLEQNKLVCQHCLQDKRYNNFIANPYGWDGKEIIQKNMYIIQNVSKEFIILIKNQINLKIGINQNQIF